MKGSTNLSFNCGDDGTKSKPQHGDPFVSNQSRGVVLLRSNHSQATSRVHSELIGWMTASLRWSSRFKMSSKPLRVSHGWNIWN